MQALLLAAGASSRFFPFNTKHKSLISLLGEPIIIHTLRAVKKSGINDVVIVTSENNYFKEAIGDGKKYGLRVQYVIQKEATGAGDAILLALPKLKDDFILANGNRVDFDIIKDAIDTKRGTNKHVVLVAQESEAKGTYGSMRVEGDSVLEILEKPGEGKELSNLIIRGQYFLNRDFIKTLKSVPSTHYSLEDALDKHAKLGLVRFAKIDQNISLKYPWHLLSLKDYLMKTKLKRSISKKAKISKSAQIEGDVVIEEGVTILENAIIKGPAYIGKNAFVGTGSLVRDGSDVEEGSVVGGFMEVKDSIIMKGSKTHSGLFEDSIMGEDSRIGANYTSANLRLDRKNIISEVKGEKVDTGRRNLGALIGSNTYFGAKIVTMPGIIIGNNVNVGPSTTVMENIPSDVTYYTEFKKIIKKNRSAPKS